MRIQNQISMLRFYSGIVLPKKAGIKTADTMEKLLAALQDIVDYHQDYHAPLNKDFDAIQDIAIAVLRDIDDLVQPGLTKIDETEAERYLAACFEGVNDYEHELVGRLLDAYRAESCENGVMRRAIEDALHCLHAQRTPSQKALEAAVAPVSEGPSLTDTVKERIADPKIVDVDLEDL